VRLAATLALRDLLRDRVTLICNMAVIAGVVVPLLVLFGVKNGVIDGLIADLTGNPATLQLDTAGNGVFTRDDLDEVRDWPGVAFATLRTRSLFDYVNVRAVGGRGLREAVLTPSGAGDPTLPPGLALPPGDVAVSAALADALSLEVGAEVEMVTQAEDRPRQLVLARRVAAVIPRERMAGRSVLADLDTLDTVEAFYDGYDLPDHGIEGGRPLSERVAAFEGMRLYAARIEGLADLQARIEARFGTRAEGRVREVESVLSLARNLDVALALVAAIAATGLAATLVFGFWAEVVRKRRQLAILALLGLPERDVALVPLVQAVVTAFCGLVLSFAVLALCAAVAQRMFGAPPGGGAGALVSVSLPEAAILAALVLLLVVGSALLAARRARRTDPALVLREAT
jgi:putative ABC transport system permease protein